MGKNVMRHPEEALACCPVSFVTKAAPPFLIIHGEDDHTVPFGQGEACLLYTSLIPGVFLIVTLLSFTSIGNYLRKQANRKQRNL